jgi:hypothetical protein
MRDDCARCGQKFDPADTSFNGRARYLDTKFCRSCIDRCHESTDFAHTCAVCATDSWAEQDGAR